MNQAPQQSAQQPWRPGLALLFTIFILSFLTSGLYLHGRDFYPLSLAERALHPAYRMLNPAGLVGHGYGIVGTGLILTNLLYLVRRRFTKYIPAWLGSVKAWLDIHVVTGLTGAVLVLFHSAFQLRTAIATVTAASLAISFNSPACKLFEFKPLRNPMQHDLVTKPYDHVNGWVYPPTGPGLGIEVIEEVVDGYRSEKVLSR